MTLLEEINGRKDETHFPNTFRISKYAEEDLYYLTKELDTSEDKVIEIALAYLTQTDNLMKFLNDLRIEFKPVY